MLRLSDVQETETTLLLSGRGQLLRWGDRALRLLGYGSQRCMLIYGVTGHRRSAARARRQAEAILRRHGALLVGPPIGREWRRTRFLAP